MVCNWVVNSLNCLAHRRSRSPMDSAVRASAIRSSLTSLVGCAASPLLQLLFDVLSRPPHEGNRDLIRQTLFETRETLLQVRTESWACPKPALSHGQERQAIGL